MGTVIKAFGFFLETFEEYYTRIYFSTITMKWDSCTFTPCDFCATTTLSLVLPARLTLTQPALRSHALNRSHVHRVDFVEFLPCDTDL